MSTEKRRTELWAEHEVLGDGPDQYTIGYRFLTREDRDAFVASNGFYKPHDRHIVTRIKRKPRSLSWAFKQLEAGRTVRSKSCEFTTGDTPTLCRYASNYQNIREATDWEVVP